MILFNLRCSKEHEFEAWFRDGATYDSQVAAGGVVCPICASTHVRKAPMAPSVVSGRGADKLVAEMREALTALRRHVETTSENVGDRFPEEARAMYYGEAAERPIYGHASAAEAEALEEEGVEVVSIPWLRQGS